MSDFKAKMHKIRFRLGLRPRPRWGSLQRSPDPLAGLKVPTSKGRGGEGMGGEKRGKERERGGEGRKGKGEGGAPSARRAQSPQNTLRRLCRGPWTPSMGPNKFPTWRDQLQLGSLLDMQVPVCAVPQQ